MSARRRAHAGSSDGADGGPGSGSGAGSGVGSVAGSWVGSGADVTGGLVAGFDTLQVHAGQRADPATGALAVPIYATAAYAFDDAASSAAIFAGDAGGNQYGRMHNPTVQVYADRVAALEGGRGGLALSSGQAATTTALMALARPGANVVVSRELFGGTFGVARKVFEPFGVRFKAVAPTADELGNAIDGDTVGVWLESIANPSGTVPDLPAVADVCHAQGVPLLVDNTFGCAGYLCRPLALGADVVVHSATKWINGHGSAVSGIVVDGGSFDWDNPRFPAFNAPDGRGRTYLSRGGDAPFLTRAGDLGLTTMGMTLSPYAAFLGLQGLETLSLRVKRQCESTLALATWLEQHPAVGSVGYPGLASHPSHATAKRMLQNGFGGVLTFATRDDATTQQVLDRLRLVSLVANLGDARTLAIHPWTTTHAGLSEDARRAAGVTPNLIRLSVGLEDVADLEHDLARALEAPVAA